MPARGSAGMAKRRAKRASPAQRRARSDFIKKFAGRLAGQSARAVGRKLRDTKVGNKAAVARDRYLGEIDRDIAKLKRLREKAVDFAYRGNGPKGAGPAPKRSPSFFEQLRARERKANR